MTTSHLSHLASPISPAFSDALRIETEAGKWIIVSGQVGVPVPPAGEEMSFEEEVRTCFERIRGALAHFEAEMADIVSMRTYFTDLGQYAEFAKVRSEYLIAPPPTSTAVEVKGLLLNARIEIEAMAFRR